MTERRPGRLATGSRLGATLLLTAGLAAALPAARADWPHLRGSNYDGVSAETGLAEAWPAAGPPQLWSRELGQGHSGFIVAQGKLYTQRQTLGGQYVLCLDPDSGQTVWETRYDWAWQPHGAYPGPYASPTWYRGRVYYASPTGRVGCLDATTGAAVWSLNVVVQFRGKGCEFGYAATPLVEDDRVILPVGGPDASLVALHAEDGRTLWTAGGDPASYCPALPVTYQGRRCVVGYLQNSWVLVESATGKLLLRQTLSSGYDEHSAWPLYREPHLLLAGPFRRPASCLELQPGPDGAVRTRTHWTSRELSNDVVSSVLYEGQVYGFDIRQLQASAHQPSRGAFRCLDWSTGRVRWTADAVGQAAVLVADGKLFLLNDSGTLVIAGATPQQYAELARVPLFADETCWTPPTLWRGRLFVRSPSQAVCLYVGRPDAMPAAALLAPRPQRRPWRIPPTWLLSREREYPNDAPSRHELTLWFASSVVLVFGGGAAVAGVAWLLIGQCVGRRGAPAVLFWAAAFVLGVLGPNVLSALADRCLFTWPASVYAAFHGTVAACWWAEHQPARRRARWLARLAMAGLLSACYGYFALCQAVGMFIGWSFLFGLPAAFPFTVLTVWSRRPWLKAAWTLLAFTAFFWSGEGLLWWKSAPDLG